MSLGSDRATIYRMSRLALVLVFINASVLACTDLTRVTNTAIVSSSLDNPTGAATLRNGAIAALWPAFTNQIQVSGFIGDELTDLTANVSSGDQRTVSAVNESQYPYRALSQFRLQALIAVAALQKYAPTPGDRIGELYALSAAVETFFAENLCSGVPLAGLVGGRPAIGPTLSRSQILQRALAHLDSAAVNTTSGDSIANLTAVLRGRALLDSGDFGAAAQAVAGVASAAAYAPYSSSLAANQLANDFRGGTSVSDREGLNGLAFRSETDPRVPTVNLGLLNGYPDSTYAFIPDTSQVSTIAFASGVEARLIVAESELPIHGGVGSAWLDTLNALRTDGTYTISASGDTVFNAGEGGVAGLRPLSDPGSDAGRVDAIFHERAFWLFLTGHRHGDLRRLIRQYGRAVESVFPTGNYWNGSRYSTAVVFVVVPSDEQQNPQFTGCFDRAP